MPALFSELPLTLSRLGHLRRLRDRLVMLLGLISDQGLHCLFLAAALLPDPPPPTAYIEKRDDLSNFCRSCKKAPPPTSRAASVPRAKLFSELTNKELTTPLNLAKVVMSDILSIWGYKFYPNDGLSQIICLSCARSMVRTYATQMKLLKNLQNQSASAEKAEKRVSGMSPSSRASPLTAIAKRRARLAQLQNQGLDGNDQNRLSPKRNIEMDFDRIEMEQEKKMFLKMLSL